MSTFTNPSKRHHDQIQREAHQAIKDKTLTVIDFAVSRAVKAGENSLSALAKKFRLTLEQIKSSISPSLFSVNHDTIQMV